MTDQHHRPGFAITSTGATAASEEPTPAVLADLIRTRPEFRVRAVDGRAWIDPYGGAAVPLSGGSGEFEATAVSWMLQSRPWRRNNGIVAPPQTLAEVLLWRWLHWAKATSLDPHAEWSRIFLHDGRWLNPFSGRPVPGIPRDGERISIETLRAMADILRDCPEAQDGLPLDHAYLANKAKEIDRATRRSTDPPTQSVPLTPKTPSTGMAVQGSMASAGSNAVPVAGLPSGGTGDRANTPQGADALKVVSGYRILGTLGLGGMSTVYRAIQQSMEREVALKVLDRDGRPEPRDIERFLREARAAGRINHPNVITCYDVGVHHGQTLYMALELVTGGDASRLAERHGGRLPESAALRILRDAARGLGAIHHAGLVHRDVKPANLFIAADGVCKLGDLGLVRDTSDKFRTLVGVAVGTPAYMSPEQASGAKDLDIRSDVYSLGSSIFALLTGRPPHQADGVVELLELVRRSPAPDIRAIRPDLSPATADLLARMLHKDRSQRFQTPAELVEAVEDIRIELTGRSSTGPMPAMIDLPLGEPRLGSGGMKLATVRGRGYAAAIQLGTEVLCLAVAASGMPSAEVTARAEARLRALLVSLKAGKPIQGGAAAAITRTLLNDGLSAVAALVDPEKHQATVACTPTARAAFFDLRDTRLVTDLLLAGGTIDLRPGSLLLLTAGTQGRPFALWGAALARADEGAESVASALPLTSDGPASLVLAVEAH